MSKSTNDWMQRLVEKYRIPTKTEKAKRILTEQQIKIIKKEVLKELNLIQSKILFTEIYSKVDPSVVKKEMKLTLNKKLSNKAAKIWANLSKTLDDSPLKDYFSNKK